MDIADSVLDLIGETPLVRLARVGAGLQAPVVAKLETASPKLRDAAVSAVMDPKLPRVGVGESLRCR